MVRENCETIQDLLSEGIKSLKEVGIESYILESQLLLGKVINKDRLFIMINKDYKVSEEEKNQYLKLIDIRKEKMPIKYILGTCEFMGLSFKIREGVLIPRPDTEILVEKSIEIIRKNHYKNISDVCCGSGIIGISIATFVDKVNVECFDVEEIPLKVTEENIKLNRLEGKVKVFKSNLLEYAIKNSIKYDMIVSNPPYIKKREITNLMEDVKNYEPHIALDGGEDGLYFYKNIVKQSKHLLNPGGTIAFEIGYDQKEEVSYILESNGFVNIECYKDLAGLDRVVIGILKTTN
ncbi:release factor glutamine methyltransferase [Clostridium tetani]|uniref:Release factor glutamine methyltransferase n=1 Tax=Clostridium tetani TaxID=1513 RepID=A0A4Q0VCK5_CLOTA|nr:peptide chain release factor N(5)-glutamine methyltransferase [Clostridium tetani]RXI48619.1 peptide chain release factor N(5)-glutamine methyltransferase [Clostridium tetani]RXM71813.1 peptide chain release factor N(5)-glutamine methyltransferase [Clostridium tetani]BDR65907.1 release factor glutamine methyltransferase [Clostridium tetani]BDR71428.1 release factor glutamine methyltransferase [Clostridium tetani]BDR79891.1 release factor glutamine methyltransferase [Clostridium tetani]